MTTASDGIPLAAANETRDINLDVHCHPGNCRPSHMEVLTAPSVAADRVDDHATAGDQFLGEEGDIVIEFDPEEQALQT